MAKITAAIDTPTSRISVERTAPGAPGLSVNFNDGDDLEGTLHLSRSEAVQLRDGITRVLVGGEDSAKGILGAMLSQKMGFDVTLGDHIKHNAQALMNITRLATHSAPRRIEDEQGPDANALRLAVAAIISRREVNDENFSSAKLDYDWRLLQCTALSNLMLAASEYARTHPECDERMAFERRLGEFLAEVDLAAQEARKKTATAGNAEVAAHG